MIGLMGYSWGASIRARTTVLTKEGVKARLPEAGETGIYEYEQEKNKVSKE